MRKTAKILCTSLPVISAAGAAAGLYKLAGYFFNYCLVRTNPGYKAAQNKAHENLSPKQAAEDFFSGRASEMVRQSASSNGSYRF